MMFTTSLYLLKNKFYILYKPKIKVNTEEMYDNKDLYLNLLHDVERTDQQHGKDKEKENVNDIRYYIYQKNTDEENTSSTN